MKIKSVKINLYKSIKEPIEINFSGVNTFIGQNNCGKSSILNAIELAFNPGLDDTYIFYHKSDIEIGVEFSNQEKNKYNFPSKNATLSLKANKRIINFNGKIIDYLQFSKELSGVIKRLKEESFLDIELIESDYKILYNYPKILRLFQNELKKYFPKVTIDEDALDDNFENSGLYEWDRRATIDHLGSGFIRVFAILLYIYHPKYQVVMIDEPENHLHPGLIKNLLWAMQSSNASQIFFTTHSPLMISAVTIPQLVRVTRDRISTRAFAYEFGNYNREKLIEVLNSDNMEMFFADKVVIVEGVSDKLLLKGLISRFYKGGEDIKVIQIFGKGNAILYSDILKIFKIPYLMVFDRDMLNGRYIFELLNRLGIKIDTKDLKELKKNNIYIFPNGCLEDNYPKKYQRKDSKFLSALYAATRITDDEFNSSKMKNLKEIISLL